MSTVRLETINSLIYYGDAVSWSYSVRVQRLVRQQYFWNQVRYSSSFMLTRPAAGFFILVPNDASSGAINNNGGCFWRACAYSFVPRGHLRRETRSNFYCSIFVRPTANRHQPTNYSRDRTVPQSRFVDYFTRTPPPPSSVYIRNGRAHTSARDARIEPVVITWCQYLMLGSKTKRRTICMRAHTSPLPPPPPSTLYT